MTFEGNVVTKQTYIVCLYITSVFRIVVTTINRVFRGITNILIRIPLWVVMCVLIRILKISRRCRFVVNKVYVCSAASFLFCSWSRGKHSIWKWLCNWRYDILSCSRLSLIYTAFCHFISAESRCTTYNRHLIRVDSPWGLKMASQWYTAGSCMSEQDDWKISYDEVGVVWCKLILNCTLIRKLIFY